MKKQIFVLLILFFAMNCSGSADPSPNLSPEASSDTVEGLPEWFLNSPEKDGFQYMAAEATSRQMQLAIDKARTDAVTSLSSMINSEWSGYVKRIQEETGIGVDSNLLDQFSKTTENTISNQLQNLKMVKKDIQVENSSGTRIYRAYVLVEFNELAAQEKMLAEVKANQELFDAIKATELLDEMNSKVEDYRNRMNAK
ncbi:MAG: hypothetical protein CBD58_04510 [bacterium TMED198]|nr:MAG: hypothetical protein CBD58_04510 [bacterium TMED198]